EQTVRIISQWRVKVDKPLFAPRRYRGNGVRIYFQVSMQGSGMSGAAAFAYGNRGHEDGLRAHGIYRVDERLQSSRKMLTAGPSALCLHTAVGQQDIVGLRAPDLLEQLLVRRGRSGKGASRFCKHIIAHPA